MFSEDFQTSLSRINSLGPVNLGSPRSITSLLSISTPRSELAQVGHGGLHSQCPCPSVHRFWLSHQLQASGGQAPMCGVSCMFSSIASSTNPRWPLCQRWGLCASARLPQWSLTLVARHRIRGALETTPAMGSPRGSDATRAGCNSDPGIF